MDTEIIFSILLIAGFAINFFVLKSRFNRQQKFMEQASDSTKHVVNDFKAHAAKMDVVVASFANLALAQIKKAAVTDRQRPNPSQRALNQVTRMERMNDRPGESKREYVRKSLKRHFPEMVDKQIEQLIDVALDSIQGKVFN